MDDFSTKVVDWQAQQRSKPVRTAKQIMQHSRWRLVTMRWNDVVFHARRLVIAIYQAVRQKGLPPYEHK